MASYRQPAVAKGNRDNICYKRPFFMCNILKKKLITWYTRTSQTIKLEDITVQPKATVCGQSGFSIPNLHLIILSSNYAHIRFELERLNKSQNLQSPV